MNRLPVFVCAVLILLLFVGSAPVIAAGDEDFKEDTISVSGTGKIKTTPDICQISLSVKSTGTDVKKLQGENAKAMTKILTALGSMDTCALGNKEIQTRGFSISEVYYPDDTLVAKYGKDVTIYQVTNNINIETDKLSCAGDIIDTAIANGANDIDYVTFTLSPEKENEYRSQALVAATDLAHKDAEVVLGALGVSLGSVHTVSVEQSYNPPVYYASTNKASYMMEAAAGPATPIDPGDVEVTATVSVTFRIV
ncbi:MAG: SIMPL domain-containing protein [Methanospirillaceae archaeon]|nr:SIMPL domain-containing protein [Methanospirillaceae archaeon]